MSTPTLRPANYTYPGAGPTDSKTAEPWVGAFIAGLSGWTLDAFDFFLVVLSLTAIGNEFGQSIPHMALTAWATLALRPVGALLFGGISDRFGRRIPMIFNLCLFAVVELATGFAPNFATLWCCVGFLES